MHTVRIIALGLATMAGGAFQPSLRGNGGPIKPSGPMGHINVA
jgi:hypothetical protein